MTQQLRIKSCQQILDDMHDVPSTTALTTIGMMQGSDVWPVGANPPLCSRHMQALLPVSGPGSSIRASFYSVYKA